MRQELLIEFLCEEIPAKLHKKAILDSRLTFENILESYGATFSEIETYISPRRITIRVKYLVQKTKDLFEEKRGPRINAPEKAINGFLKTNNKRKEDLIEKDGYFYLNIHTLGTETKEIIPEIIEDFIKGMPWPKSMRWYLENQKTLSAFWIRPIRSILCIYDEDPISAFIESVGLTTCDYTFGHRFLSSESIKVFDFEDYAYKLKKERVMLDYYKKRSFVDKELVQTAAGKGLCVQIDEDLLDEVAGLVEFPFIHLGSINEKFMILPHEVLSTSMRAHQKYFTLLYPDSNIAPFFGTVTNVPTTSVMSDGLDRVLRARLSDAMFFYKEDTYATLEAFTQRLSSIVFHEKLGSISQKVDRMMSIADTKEEHRAAALCKADLLTQMVGEFPELQGIMGGIYAKVQDEDPEVSVAIREHYKPLGANDSLPNSYTGARIAFFDKLDTLVGFIGIGVYPTGSKDPFALRRTGFSIVRLLCDFEKNILEDESLDWYIKTLIESYSEQGIALDHNTSEEVKNFIIERLRAYMTEKMNIDSNIAESIMKSCSIEEIDYRKIITKAKNLDELSKVKDFDIIKNALKRVKGIIGEKPSKIAINSIKFEDENMNNLLLSILRSIKKRDTEEFLDSVIETSKSVLDACDKVLINDPNKNIKEKNIAVLSAFINLINETFGDV
ncbi:MAG: glycine--tRNA ligase subunit beta [Holosporales bacterium]|jgi:glycyl-tRNA synthetase beta chain|nr:glycine--tRNA ligase subunit beta [Holosporales bacterium]